jgi:hypothetical protein
MLTVKLRLKQVYVRPQRRTKTHKDTDNFLVTVGDEPVKHPKSDN